MSENVNLRWDYTEGSLGVADKKKFFEEAPFKTKDNGRYQGRKIIGRDSRINKGVYLCATSGRPNGEAIVVDDENNPYLKESYSELVESIRAESGLSGKRFNQLALERSFEYVKVRLPYREKIVDEMNKNIKDGRKYDLGNYLREGAGVCRHQALFLGYLLERMVDDGLLKGKVSVDRNYDPELGGHAWVRYITSSGVVIILDVAHNKIGQMEKINKDSFWDYRRPEEKFV